MAFTEALKAVMKAKNLRAVDIASDEVTSPYLSRLLNGKVKEPTWQKKGPSPPEGGEGL